MDFANLIRVLLDMNNGIFFDSIHTLRESYESFLRLVGSQKKEHEEGYKKQQEEFDKISKARWNEFKEKYQEELNELEHELNDCRDLDMNEPSEKKDLTSEIRHIYILHEKYQIILEKQLARKHKQSQANIEDEFEERQYHVDTCYEDVYYIEAKMEDNFLNSIVISVYALIKKYLNNICEHVYHEPRGDIERVITYMKNHKQINIDDEDIDFLNSLKAIRDVIVDDDGELCDKSDKDIEKIKRMAAVHNCKIVQDNSGDKIVVNIDFIEYCLKRVGGVYYNIFKQLITAYDLSKEE